LINQLITIIDTLNENTGKLVSWLSLLLVAVIGYDVLMRYVFDSSTAAMFELEWHLFAALFLLSMAYALKHDKHVRVDVFYTRFSARGKAIVNFIGALFFLIPFCMIVITTSIPFVMDSYKIMESSPDPGGLPFRFIIKSCIPIGMFLLLLQAISMLLQSLLIIINKPSADK